MLVPALPTSSSVTSSLGTRLSLPACGNSAKDTGQFVPQGTLTVRLVTSPATSFPKELTQEQRPAGGAPLQRWDRLPMDVSLSKDLLSKSLFWLAWALFFCLPIKCNHAQSVTLKDSPL